MSAFIVDKRHIDALLQFALNKHRHAPLRWGNTYPFRELSYENVDEVGQILLSENIASVAYRYKDGTAETLPGRADHEWTEPYRFRRYYKELPAGHLFSALACYEYQACEHPGWRDSEALQFCEALRRFACRFVHGYSDGPWDIHDD